MLLGWLSSRFKNRLQHIQPQSHLAINVPIDLSSTFEKGDTRLPNNGRPHLYSRLSNPNRTAFELQLTAIHQMQHALAAQNVKAAYYALSLMFKAGDEVIVCGQRQKWVQMIRDIFEGQEMGVEVKVMNKIELSERTKGVIVDQFHSDEAFEFDDKEVIVIRDCSLVYPMLLHGQFPKADYIICDLTYYSGIDGGHGGVIMSNDAARHAKVLAIIKAIGNGMQPMDCFINMRGLKTLGIRIKEQLRQKQKIVEYLNSNQISFSTHGHSCCITIEMSTEEVKKHFKSLPGMRNSNFTHFEMEDRFTSIHVGIDDVTAQFRL